MKEIAKNFYETVHEDLNIVNEWFDKQILKDNNEIDVENLKMILYHIIKIRKEKEKVYNYMYLRSIKEFNDTLNSLIATEGMDSTFKEGIINPYLFSFYE